MATIEEIDTDIASVRAQIAQLQSQRANLSSVLLSTPHVASRLKQHVATGKAHESASKVVKKQAFRNLENIYNGCAGVTAYKVRDPDPHAVDNGNVLGIRIDVSVRDRFIDTYHVLLHRPEEASGRFKIHKHTIPTTIPTEALARKYNLGRKSTAAGVEQDLIQFGKALRKELVAWQLRVAAVEHLRAEAGLTSEPSKQPAETPSMGKPLNTQHAFSSDEEDGEDNNDSFVAEDEEFEPRARRRAGPVKIIDIEMDPEGEVRELRVVWSDGQLAILRITKDGEIERAVVRTSDGLRVARLEKKALGRIERLVQRLKGDSSLSA